MDEKYDPTNRTTALRTLEDAKEKDMLLTGLLYYNPRRASLVESERLTDIALSHLSETELRPSEESLRKIMAEM